VAAGLCVNHRPVLLLRIATLLSLQLAAPAGGALAARSQPTAVGQPLTAPPRLQPPARADIAKAGETLENVAGVPAPAGSAVFAAAFTGLCFASEALSLSWPSSASCQCAAADKTRATPPSHFFPPCRSASCNLERHQHRSSRGVCGQLPGEPPCSACCPMRRRTLLPDGPLRTAAGWAAAHCCRLPPTGWPRLA
jgi:hypothetical protein